MSSLARWLEQWMLLLIAGVALLGSSTLPAEEKISDFHSHIQVMSDGAIEVTETITVSVEGQRIKRGIFRDFPTDYRDRLGNRYRAGFEVLWVNKNGVSEPYRTKRRSNGKRVYIGDEATLLTPGTYQYQIGYRSDRQLGYFDTYDELYWNVTGNGWLFAIEQVSGEVHLPVSEQSAAPSATEVRMAVYTGITGSTERAAQLHYRDGVAYFESDRAFAPAEGLTIAIGWPKGLVSEPSPTQRGLYLLKDNRGLLWGSVALALILVYYLYYWNKVGRDPRKGVIIPRYQPPEGLSPAGCYYILNMGSGYQAVSAAVISCAVKGYLHIEQLGKSKFQLYRKRLDQETIKTLPALSPGEHQVLSALLSPGETLSTDDEEYKRFSKACRNLDKRLSQQYYHHLFSRNTRYWLPGAGLCVAAMVVQLLLLPSPLQLIGLMAGCAILMIVFYVLLRAPTARGRAIMDEIEGFKMYLNTAEQDRLERMKAPHLTPEVFEMFLPYALALGVANSWCRRFEQYLAQLNQQPDHYMPLWYSGSNLSDVSRVQTLGQGLGRALSGAISSAASPPGSSSGSSGGGSSGGGGGGGGGGGW